MAIHINSDKEKFRADKPRLIGDSELTVRGGTGANEKEILRTQLDDNTGLPRVGINRTGQRVNEVKIISGGSGYVSAPTVTIAAPAGGGGVQAQGSAFIFNGQVVSVAINEPGTGYTQAPLVTLSGGGGAGASVEAVLDTVDFELDINGAIRTSTSIISDTARILNLDIDNFVTPNAAFRAPSLKTFANNTGTLWSPNIILQENAYRYFGQNIYQALNSGQTGNNAPTHTDGTALNGEVTFKHIGFRVVDQNAYGIYCPTCSSKSGVYCITCGCFRCNNCSKLNGGFCRHCSEYYCGDCAYFLNEDDFLDYCDDCKYAIHLSQFGDEKARKYAVTLLGQKAQSLKK